MKPDWSVERRDVERVAEDYRARGYEVVVEPTSSELPDFVREYRPDIVARSNRESVVIEVKLPRSDADRQRVRAMASSLEHRPGWRFVLVAPEPKEAIAPGEALRVMSPIDVEQLLVEVQSLVRSGHKRGALLIGWAALEAAMRLAAEHLSLDARRPDSWMLMRELVSRGILDRERYQPLVDLYQLRSALAHGFEPVEGVSRFDLDQAVATVGELTRDLLAESQSTRR